METPIEKYHGDKNYRSLVDSLEALINHAEFTPSEIREACVLACINHEYRRRRDPIILTKEAAAAMGILESEFLERRNF